MWERGREAGRCLTSGTAFYMGVCMFVVGCEQKWSKGKVREKVANKVLFDNDTYQRLSAEIPKVSNWGTTRLRSRSLPYSGL